MTTTFTRTRQQLADAILRKLGVLDPGGTVEADHYAVVYEAMDLRLKSLHSLGVFWRKVPGRTTKSVSGITRTGSTATATSTAHGYAVGTVVTVAGANEADYNITAKITAVTTNTFDYAVAGTPTTPATGTITVTAAAEMDVATTANVATVLAPGDMLLPLWLGARDVSDDFEIRLVGAREYAEVRTKSDTGRPELAYLVGSTFYLHPIPDSAYVLKLVYEKMIEDTATGLAPDVDVAMLRALKLLVAYDVADDFGVAEARMARLAMEARAAERDIRVLSAPRIDPSPVKVVNY